MLEGSLNSKSSLVQKTDILLIICLRLVDTQGDLELKNERKDLEQETTELTNIFGSILRKMF